MSGAIYAVVDPTDPEVYRRMMPVKGTPNGDGTCSLQTVGGSGSGSGAGEKITWTLTRKTLVAGGTAEDAIDAESDGQYFRLVNTDPAEKLYFAIGTDATTADEYLNPNEGVSIPVAITNSVSVLAATDDHPYSVYVGVAV
jgi:hypothetical protein